MSDVSNTLLFSRLEVEDWRQFDKVTIEFHPRLTVLTGANASGKSTLLGILARHFNWSRMYSAAPVRARSGLGIGRLWNNLGLRRSRHDDTVQQWSRVGELAYSNGVVTQISVPPPQQNPTSQYDLALSQQQMVTGLFLNSHRSVTGSYSMVSTIPTLFGSADDLFEQFTNEVRTRWLGSWSGKTAMLTLKESLIAAAVFGDSQSESVEPNLEARAIWSGFQGVLSSVLPRSLRFKRLRVRIPDVILETDSGDFIIDEASGGVSAIIELSWQIFLRSRRHPRFVVLLDEPENHLHPSLQREILPNLLSAFPNVQFVVATHSPFVVTATPDSFVYVLDYNDENRVYNRRLDYVNKAGNADETLTRVLGLSSTLPGWAERNFEEIIERYAKGSVSDESMAAMRKELRDSGLIAKFPVALAEVADAASGNRGQ